ncbi:MAG: type II toxin-antitoxin system MqsR family toxin [Phycisphaerales bacterium]|nr:type II toxin-antitoxin system MqsR family toxin [Phycisphaerales bacterium]
MPIRQDVHEFLRSFKLAIDFGLCHFRDRTRTEQDLIDLNFTQRQAMEAICELTPNNYCKGPEPDDTDPSKDVWVFGYNHEGTEVYVKLRLNPRRRNEIPWAIIWSFHAAEFNMTYPLRGGA